METKEQVSLDRQRCHERKILNINVGSDRKDTKRREWKEREREREMGRVFSPFHALCPPSGKQQPVFLAAVEQGTCLGFFLSSVSRSW